MIHNCIAGVSYLATLLVAKKSLNPKTRSNTLGVSGLGLRRVSGLEPDL